MAAVRMGITGLLVILSVFSTVYGGGKTLVLVDNWAIRETHSIVFRSLRGMYFCRKLLSNPDRHATFTAID